MHILQIRRAVGARLIDDNEALFQEANALAEILGDVHQSTEALVARRNLCSNPERTMVSFMDMYIVKAVADAFFQLDLCCLCLDVEITSVFIRGYACTTRARDVVCKHLNMAIIDVIHYRNSLCLDARPVWLSHTSPACTDM